jgi:hypothetical protein
MNKTLFVALFLLYGCATTETYWVKPGASSTEFYQDRGQCQAQAFGTPGMYTLQIALIFNGCMQGKGWHQEQAAR